MSPEQYNKNVNHKSEKISLVVNKNMDWLVEHGFTMPLPLQQLVVHLDFLQCQMDFQE